MKKKKMPHAGHDMHLCYLHNLGFATESPSEYQALVRDAKFICLQCGRAAANKENLCKPQTLRSD